MTRDMKSRTWKQGLSHMIFLVLDNGYWQILRKYLAQNISGSIITAKHNYSWSLCRTKMFGEELDSLTPQSQSSTGQTPRPNSWWHLRLSSHNCAPQVMLAHQSTSLGPYNLQHLHKLILITWWVWADRRAKCPALVEMFLHKPEA